MKRGVESTEKLEEEKQMDGHNPLLSNHTGEARGEVPTEGEHQRDGKDKTRVWCYPKPAGNDKMLVIDVC